MSDVEILTTPVSSQEQAVVDAPEPPKVPAPSALGNAKLPVLKHDLVRAFQDPLDNGKRFPAGVQLAISNDSDTTIATAIFEALFYDGEGNVLETIKHTELDLPPGRSRRIRINSSQYEEELVKSYEVRLIRTTTADVEKVQPRRHEIWTTETGEEAVRGIVKNISQVKTDAAVVITFYDVNKNSIGTKAVVLKDIEPDSIRQYDLVFKPQEGDFVASYILAIGEVAA